ncbi:unnamed protein product [Hermetia illucens]|uniref:Uncharacterized protein n=1 Tax=Hermetia illucens TaxID=343691 RepID=A0A7R8UN90_HERIL|nr:unnamed protein product [Hermetia illucens]
MWLTSHAGIIPNSSKSTPATEIEKVIKEISWFHRTSSCERLSSKTLDRTTLRHSFIKDQTTERQKFQEGRTNANNEQQPQVNTNQKPQSRDQRPQIEEPGPPVRPALPQRLMIVLDPSQQHANRPLPPIPKISPSSSSSAGQQQTPEQRQRNSQNMLKPVLSPRKPEDLDMLAAQLKELGVSQQSRQKSSEQAGKDPSKQQRSDVAPAMNVRHSNFSPPAQLEPAPAPPAANNHHVE